MIKILCLDCKHSMKIFTINSIIKEHWECSKCKSKNLVFLEEEDEKTTN